MAKSKALFLDRDGTILKEIQSDNPSEPQSLGYLIKTEQVELIEGSAEAIAIACSLGFKIIVITNQSAIARGWLSIEELENINSRMSELLSKENDKAVIDDLFFSPYFKEGTVKEYSVESNMRKPGTGMIDEAVKKHNIDLGSSYIIGDAYSDMKTGENAGIKSILVNTGYGKIAYKKCLDEKLKIDFIADNLLDAVGFIAKNAKN